MPLPIHQVLLGSWGRGPFPCAGAPPTCVHLSAHSEGQCLHCLAIGRCMPEAQTNVLGSRSTFRGLSLALRTSASTRGSEGDAGGLRQGEWRREAGQEQGRDRWRHTLLCPADVLLWDVLLRNPGRPPSPPQPPLTASAPIS